MTRAQLIGVEYRIAAVYGGSLHGQRIMMLYGARFGMRNEIMRRALERASADGLHPMQPTNREPCSRDWHRRAAMTASERLSQERHARVMRGEKLDRFMRRQAV